MAAPSAPSPRCVVGIDLAGVERRRTGFAVLRGLRIELLQTLGSDGEIVRRTVGVRPEVTAIDAPLFLPEGRRSLADRRSPHLRACDRQLRGLGIPVLPVSLGPMRLLTARGIALRGRLESYGLRVVETYPMAVQRRLRIPTKREGIERLAQGLRRQGVVGLPTGRAVTHDELDAVSAALAARAVQLGTAQLLGDDREGHLAIPDAPPARGRSGWRRMPRLD